MKEKSYSRAVLLTMLAGFTYMCSNMMTTSLFTGYVESLGGGFWMGTIAGIMTATSFVCRPITGELADRMEKLRLSLIGALMLLAANLGYCVFSSIWLTAALRVVQGGGYAFCSVGISTWLAMLLPPQKLGSGAALQRQTV